MGMSAILVKWPKQFVFVFIWNLSLIGQMVSEKTMF